jgi:2-polyprenyl-3-methyl-5-hydroxy-6-metoxy-1,4-benzoquinol methylase
VAGTTQNAILQDLAASAGGATATTGTSGVLEIPLVTLDSAAAVQAGRIGAEPGRPVLARLSGHPADEALAALRNALWPTRHVAALYRVAADGTLCRTTLGGSKPLAGRGEGPATVLYVVHRDDALGQAATRTKFDANAPGWNGNPGAPGYGHYRWMRRLVAQVARPGLGSQVLDAGCGTGWVGIEAARMGASVSALDASPAMVELARQNAQSLGLELDARVGFVEQPPFERRFDTVLNSGVISFAPDPTAYLRGLDGLVAPGGLLVIGDIHPDGRGFRRRRRTHALLPTRELNGLPRERAEEALAALGYRIEARRFYQLSYPVPQLMALCERRGSAAGCALLLALNRAASALDAAVGSVAGGAFDSWILRARKPA